MNLHAEPSRLDEVPLIVRDDGFTPRGDRQLQDHVILGIRKIGAPKEEDTLPVRHTTEVVQETIDISLTEKRRIQVPGKSILVFEQKGYGYGHLEVPLLEERYQLKRGSLP